MEKVDIVRLIARRDNISMNEAWNIVNMVCEELAYAVAHGRYEEVEDIMLSELGLEMDYVDALLL